MPLEPRLTPFVWLANHAPENPDALMQQRRAAGAAIDRLFSRLVLRPGAAVAATTERLVPVEGGLIRVRIYRPQGVGPFPLHVFLHGGGWCGGTLDQRDNRCMDLAADAGCVVASVEYRLAPENRFPTATEDSYQALCFLVERADELRVDPRRVSIGGESAGGNLAAVICLMARDRGGPRLLFQLLDVPATDLTMSQPSVAELGTGYLLTRTDMERYIDAYLPDAALVTDPLASPLHAPDLSGLPPAMVTTCEFDPLRDEGAAYAARLQEAGVPAQHVRLAGHVHPSFAFTRLLASAREHHGRCVAALRGAYRDAVTTV
jgi:acetyl esterase